ncbi:MAG TPA: hypothetical protein VM733_13950 [Thermoanaerobaculia bacterium]|nr:hypothetical protein [Thermoanaerobaculia bacterium]
MPHSTSVLCGILFATASRMAHAQAAEVVQTLEHGSIAFLFRPRVEEQHPDELQDVQRLLLLLTPNGSAFQRAIAVGRKRLPRSARRDRFWGFVDLVLTHYDMNAALGAQVYGTKTRGLRHLPAARVFAEGTYEIALHDGHAHFSWCVTRIAADEPLANEIELEEEADYILTVANPDPAAWGLTEPPDLQTTLFDDLELHVPLPTPFPPSLQQRFRNRRFTQLDSIEWLDHPGAELVFIGAGE